MFQPLRKTQELMDLAQENRTLTALILISLVLTNAIILYMWDKGNSNSIPPSMSIGPAIKTGPLFACSPEGGDPSKSPKRCKKTKSTDKTNNQEVKIEMNEMHSESSTSSSMHNSSTTSTWSSSSINSSLFNSVSSIQSSNTNTNNNNAQPSAFATFFLMAPVDLGLLVTSTFLITTLIYTTWYFFFHCPSGPGPGPC